jgi:predicted  nucleic acid-binding Zn-ribbon protein
MDNLERLAGSIAQIELLVASLKRENRDLAARLAQAGQERRQSELAAEARLRDLQAQLSEAQTVLRNDPGLEARAQQAELEAADLARQLDEARRSHFEEKGRFEALIRQLEHQALAAREFEELPTASAEALREAQQSAESLRQEKAAVKAYAAKLEQELQDLRGRLDRAADREATLGQEAEALRARQAELEKRVTSLESHGLDLERQLGEAQLRLAESAKPDEVAALQARLLELEALAAQAAGLRDQADKLAAEKAELKRQKRDLAAYSKEKQTLRRKVEELVATLESVRLG